MSNTGTLTNREELLQLLDNEDINQALQTTLEKLPKVLDQFEAIEQTMSVVQDIAKYRSSITELVGEFGSLSVSNFPEITIGDDTIQAIATMVDKLPKIAQYLAMMDDAFNIIQTVVTDKKLMHWAMQGAKELAEPIQNKINDGVSIVNEAKQRAQQDTSTMSIFAVMRLLKDPTVQDGLRFTKALLSVVSERNQKLH